MYRIEDSVSATKELQRLLGLNQTGDYDKATRSEVIKMQERYSLPKTAKADYETFKVIVKEHRSNKEKAWHSDYLYSPSFPFRDGDMGDNVRRINEALSTVLKDYHYEGIIPKGAYFGEDTANGVRYMQKVFVMQETGIIDAVFMNRILSELKGIEIKRQYR